MGVFQQPVRLAFEFYKGSQVLLCMLQDLYVTSARVKNIPLFVSGFPCGLHYFYFLLSIGYSREKPGRPVRKSGEEWPRGFEQRWTSSRTGFFFGRSPVRKRGVLHIGCEVITEGG